MANINSNSKYTPVSSISAPWLWLALIGSSLFSIVVFFWAYFGVVTETVSGRGIIVLGDGIYSITAKTDGVIKHLTLEAGSVVEESMIVGHIHNYETFYKMNTLENKIAALNEQIEQTSQSHKELSKLRQTTNEEHVKLLKGLEKEMIRNQERLNELAISSKKLATERIIAKTDHYKLLNEHLTNKNLITNTKISELRQQYALKKEMQEDAEETLDLEVRLESLMDELTYIKNNAFNNCWIRSEDDGRVMEVFKQIDDEVKAGDRIATVVTGEKNSKAIKIKAFVPAHDGKKVKVGMSVFFSPSVFRSSEYGYLKGIVSKVSLFPISSEAIKSRYKSNSFQKFVDNQDFSLAVEIELLPSEKSKNGYAWTSENGYKVDLTPGMLGELLINVEFRNPISYVLPYLREKFMK